MGEDIDDFVVRTQSKTRDIIKDYTSVASNAYKGVDVLDENGNLRNTYNILLDIARVYKEIQEEDKKNGTNRAQALVEELAGKNRSNIASSILLSPELLENVYKSSQKSEGSAQEELDKYLDSIEGKTKQFSNQVQELATNLIYSSLVKGIVDLGTFAVDAINNLIESFGALGGIVTTVSGLFGGSVLFKFITGSTFNGEGRLKDISQFGNSILKTIKTTISAFKDAKALQSGQLIAPQASGGLYDFITQLSTAESASQAASTAVSGLWGVIAAHPIMAAVAGIGALVAVMDLLTTSSAEAHKAMEDALDNYDAKSSELNDVNEQLKETQSQIAALKGKETLTFVEKEQLEDLEQANSLLKIQQDILKKQAEDTAKEAVKKTVETYEADYGYADTINNGQATQQLIDKYSKEGYISQGSGGQGLTEDPNNIAALLAAYINYENQYEELLNKADKATGKQKNKFKKDADDVKSSLDDVSSTLTSNLTNSSDLIKSFDVLGYDNLTSEQQQVYDILKQNIDLIYKITDPKKWQEFKLDEIFKDDALKKSKDDLISLAKASNNVGITVEDVSKKYPKLANAIKRSGLKLSDFVSSINDEAGVINRKDLTDQIMGKLSTGLVDKHVGDQASSQIKTNISNYLSTLSNEQIKVIFDADVDWGTVTVADLKEIVEAQVNDEDTSITLSSALSDEALTSIVGTQTTDIETLVAAQKNLSNHSKKTQEVLSDLFNGLSPTAIDKISTSTDNLDDTISSLLKDADNNILDQFSNKIESLRKAGLDSAANYLQIYANQLIESAHNVETASGILGGVKFEAPNVQGVNDAQNQSEEGDLWETQASHFKRLQELLKSGEVGTKEFKALAAEFDETGSTAVDDAQKNVERLSSYYNSESKKQSVDSFWGFMQGKGLVNEDGEYTFTSIEDAAAKAGVTVEQFRGLLGAAVDLGGYADFFETIDEGTGRIQELDERIESLNKREQELNNGTIKTTEEKKQKQLQDIQVEREQLKERKKNLEQLIKVNKEYQKDVQSDDSHSLKKKNKPQTSTAENTHKQKDSEDFQANDGHRLQKENSTKDTRSDAEKLTAAIDDTGSVLTDVFSQLPDYGTQLGQNAGDAFIGKLSGEEFFKEFNKDQAQNDPKYQKDFQPDDKHHLRENNEVKLDFPNIVDFAKEDNTNTSSVNISADNATIDSSNTSTTTSTSGEIFGGSGKKFGEEITNSIDTSEIIDSGSSFAEKASDGIANSANVIGQAISSSMKKENEKPDIGWTKPVTQTTNAQQNNGISITPISQQIDQIHVSGVMDSVDTSEVDGTILNAEANVTNVTGADGKKVELDATVNADSLQNDFSSEMTISATNDQAKESADDADSYASGKKPEMKIAANGSSAISTANSTASTINSMTSTISVDANTSGIDTAISKALTKDFHINVRANVTGMPSGGAVKAVPEATGTATLATGSIKSYADGSLYTSYRHGMNAYANGSWSDWGLPDDQVALVNEESNGIGSSESIVRDGRWSLIPGGAHFQALKRGDIIFSANQTRELIKYGKINGHGKTIGMNAHVNGSFTAHANGTAYNMLNLPAYSSGAGGYKPTATTTTTPTTPSTNTKAIQKSIDKAGKDTQQAAKTASDKISDGLQKILDELAKYKDWIEVKLDRDQREADLNDINSQLAVGYTGKNVFLSEEDKNYQTLIKDNEKGSKRYEKRANFVAKQVGLPKKLYDRVKNGTIDIQKLSTDDKARVDAVSEWWTKVLDTKKATVELKQKLIELDQTKLSNITDQFEATIASIKNTLDLIDTLISGADAKGRKNSTTFYNAGIVYTTQNRDELIAERDVKQKQLNNSKNIKKGSLEWKQAQNEIDALNVSIEEQNNKIIELNNNIRQVEWNKFDDGIKAIDRLNQEATFMVDILSRDDDLFDDQGYTTNTGRSTLALYAQNYEADAEKLRKTNDEIARLRNEIESDPNKALDGNIHERLNNLIDDSRNLAKSMEDSKDSIQDFIKNGITKQVEALNKVISKTKEALSSQKDLYSYSNDQQKKQAELSKLEKQLAVRQGDKSDEGQARTAKLMSDIEEKRKDLEESQQDHMIDSINNALDKLSTDYEEALTDKAKNRDALLKEVIQTSNNNKDTIKKTLEDEASHVGTTLSEKMNSIWGSEAPLSKVVNAALSSDGKTGIQGQLATIIEEIGKLYTGADKKAQDNLNQYGIQTGAQSNTAGSEQTNANILTRLQAFGTKHKKSVSSAEKKKHNAVWEYIVKNYGYAPSNKAYNQIAKLLGVSGKVTGKSKDKASDASTKKEILAALKNLNGYAVGKRKTSDEMAWIGENSSEYVIRKSDGAILQKLNAGDSVLTAAQVDNIYKMSKDPAEYFKSFTKPNMNVEGMTGNYDISMTVNNNFDLKNVTNPQEFMNYMQNNKTFEKMLQDMTLGAVSNNNRLAKYRHSF